MHGNLNIWEILWQSGPVVKAVLLILIVCSVASWAIIIQKMKEFKIIDEANQHFLGAFKSNASMGELFQAAVGNQESTMGIMYRKGYEEINRLNEKLGDKKHLAEYLKNQNFVPVERALKQGVSQVQEVLDLRIATLATIGSVAPFIGLFGTVWGIIDAFSGLASGGGSIEAVAPGIAEALVATAVGLAAAIPAVWFYNNFNTRLQRMQNQMDGFGQDFLNLVERSLIVLRKD
ncbi:MAG: MotA/TolQ/ExbB proton channel family protein [Bacteriovoracaceae bacterium]|nr:MotA/TolQ/ExbB proton channel family protein [Bacteriovoracaceae bacterium]